MGNAARKFTKREEDEVFGKVEKYNLSPDYQHVKSSFMDTSAKVN